MRLHKGMEMKGVIPGGATRKLDMRGGTGGSQMMHGGRREDIPEEQDMGQQAN